MSKEELGNAIKHLCSDFKSSLPEVSKVLALGFASDVRIQSRGQERNPKYWEATLARPLEQLSKRFPQIIEEAFQMMDEKKDGRLDKVEFVKNFIPAMSRYFKPSIFRLYATGISLDNLPGYQAQVNSPFSNLSGTSGSASPSGKPEPSPISASSPSSPKDEGANGAPSSPSISAGSVSANDSTKR